MKRKTAGYDENYSFYHAEEKLVKENLVNINKSRDKLNTRINTILKALSAFFIFLLFLLFTGCSVNEEVFLKGDGSGTVSSQVVVKPIFIDYMKSMAEVTGESNKLKDGKIFDIENIRKTMEERPGITVVKIENPSPEKLNLRLKFSNVEEVFKSEKDLTSVGLISFSRTAKGKLLKFHLDKKNFHQLLAVFPELSNPIVESMGPQEDEDTTEAEYLEMIQFALGEKGPEAVKTSSIKLTIHVDGKLLSQSGGKLKDKKTVVFKLPLLKLLLLNEPIDYSILFE